MVTILSLRYDSVFIMAILVTRTKGSRIIGRIVAISHAKLGIVASGKEAAALHERLRNFLIVTPGIRQAGTDVQDQTRVVTPTIAVQSGADYLVIGRPITRADDPRAAAQEIAEEIAGAIEAG